MYYISIFIRIVLHFKMSSDRQTVNRGNLAPLNIVAGFHDDGYDDGPSMLNRYVRRRNFPPHASTMLIGLYDGHNFGDRITYYDWETATKYYPNTLLSILDELHKQYLYDISIVDDWIIHTFPEYDLVRGQPFTALSEVPANILRERLMADEHAPTERRVTF